MYLRLGILALFIALVAGNVYFWQRSEIAVKDKQLVEKELSKVVDVNKENTKTIQRLETAAKEERQATEKEIADTQQRASALGEIKKDMENVPGANEKAGAFWDAFSERLQRAQRNH